jgi:acetyl-CoA carboxylase biotin carboxyl carrier protein
MCIVEAMKIMNENQCERSGTVKEILVEDGSPVEFHTPLIILNYSE